MVVVEKTIKPSNLIVITDDTDDPFNKELKTTNSLAYIHWHSLIFPRSSLDLVEKQWMAIKKKATIPDLFLHSTDHLANAVNRQKDWVLEFLDEVHNLLDGTSSVCHAVSVIPTPEAKEIKTHSKAQIGDTEVFNKWNFNNPKGISLYCHLKAIDNYIGRSFYQPSGFAFCNTVYPNKLPSETDWRGLRHFHVQHLDPTISFYCPGFSKDTVGNCIDLADYMAWSTQFTIKKLRLREFNDLGADEKIAELDKRAAAFKPGEAKIYEFVRCWLETGRTVQLENPFLSNTQSPVLEHETVNGS